VDAACGAKAQFEAEARRANRKVVEGLAAAGEIEVEGFDTHPAIRHPRFNDPSRPFPDICRDRTIGLKTRRADYKKLNVEKIPPCGFDAQLPRGNSANTRWLHRVDRK